MRWNCFVIRVGNHRKLMCKARRKRIRYIFPLPYSFFSSSSSLFFFSSVFLLFSHGAFHFFFQLDRFDKLTAESTLQQQPQQQQQKLHSIPRIHQLNKKWLNCVIRINSFAAIPSKKNSILSHFSLSIDFRHTFVFIDQAERRQCLTFFRRFHMSSIKLW